MKLKDLKGKLQIGMVVREVRKGKESASSYLQNGGRAMITSIGDDRVGIGGSWYRWIDDIEIDMTPAWDNLLAGMEVERNGYSRKILAVNGGVIGLSHASDYGISWQDDYSWAGTIKYLQKSGYTLVGTEEITIEGKKYKAEDVRRKLKDLTPLE